MKHNISKIHKAKEAVAEIEAKKTKLVEDNAENEKLLPKREKELVELTALKAQIEQEFEKEEQRVREMTERLRKEKEGHEATLNPLTN